MAVEPNPKHRRAVLISFLLMTVLSIHPPIGLVLFPVVYDAVEIETHRGCSPHNHLLEVTIACCLSIIGFEFAMAAYAVTYTQILVRFAIMGAELAANVYLALLYDRLPF